MKSRCHIVFGLILACSPLLLCHPAEAQGDAYRIGPKDLLGIKVFEVADLNDLKLRVSEDGMIRLPIVGDVKVGGMTAAGAARHIKDVLEEKYVRQATVDVQILEFRARPISVMGAVKQPGPLEFAGPWTLLEAITAAGGIADNHGATVQVLRRADNGLTDQLTVNLTELLGGDPAVNVPLTANDLVNVPADINVTVYCLGEVNSPGAQTFRSSERITLLTAIARAGGLSDRASKQLVIKRQDHGKASEIQVDYRDVLSGKKPDVPLQAGDIIVVKESFF